MLESKADIERSVQLNGLEHKVCVLHVSRILLCESYVGNKVVKSIFLVSVAANLQKIVDNIDCKTITFALVRGFLFHWFNHF